MLDILVFAADPYELENQSCMEPKSNFDCSTSLGSANSLSSTSKAPINEVSFSIVTKFKPRLPPSPNKVVLDATEGSEVTKVLQMSFNVNRKFQTLIKPSLYLQASSMH